MDFIDIIDIIFSSDVKYNESFTPTTLSHDKKARKNLKETKIDTFENYASACVLYLYYKAKKKKSKNLDKLLYSMSEFEKKNPETSKFIKKIIFYKYYKKNKEALTGEKNIYNVLGFGIANINNKERFMNFLEDQKQLLGKFSTLYNRAKNGDNMAKQAISGGLTTEGITEKNFDLILFATILMIVYTNKEEDNSRWKNIKENGILEFIDYHYPEEFSKIINNLLENSDKLEEKSVDKIKEIYSTFFENKLICEQSEQEQSTYKQSHSNYNETNKNLQAIIEEFTSSVDEYYSDDFEFNIASF